MRRSASRRPVRFARVPAAEREGEARVEQHHHHAEQRHRDDELDQRESALARASCGRRPDGERRERQRLRAPVAVLPGHEHVDAIEDVRRSARPARLRGLRRCALMRVRPLEAVVLALARASRLRCSVLLDARRLRAAIARSTSACERSLEIARAREARGEDLEGESRAPARAARRPRRPRSA